MLLIAATAYNQSSRRAANNNSTASRTQREEPATTKKSASTAPQSKDRSAIAKPRPTERKTYHYDQNTSVRNTPTYSEPTTSAHRSTNSNTTTVTRSRTQSTTPARVESRAQGEQINRKRTVTSQPSYQKPRESQTVTSHKPSTQYREYSSPRVYREQHTVVHYYHSTPAPKAYRAKYYVYRRPPEYNIIWTPVMYRHYVRMYPMVTYWHYTNGYRIGSISAYDAEFYRGEVMTVYGRVSEVYYSYTTDEYFLYFGLYYPHQDFTVVVPGYIARRYSRHPERFFDNSHLAVTGLITTYNGEPEIVVKEKFQINLY